MLEARSVALVGASPRPSTLGHRMVAQMARSPAAPQTYLVNPRHAEIGGVPCHPSLADLPEPVDLVLLGVPDAALAGQVDLAARRGDRSVVIFGGACGPSGTASGTRCPRGRSRSSPTPARCSPPCCAPAGPSATR
jgi:acyl-CoA synthetase (NDP forming)